jgi:thimet oligopeptidase
MRHRTALLLALALGAAAARAAPPSLPGPAFPQYVTPAALEAACSRHLAEVQAAVKKLERRPVDAGWLAASDDLNALTEDRAHPFFLITNVHPDKAMREASEACELRWQSYFTALGQNETLYKAARRVKPRDAIDRELLKTTLEGFEDAGVSLPAAQRARAKALNDRIDQLGQTFDKNIRDDAT